MNRRPPRSTRTDTLFPYTTLFRSLAGDIGREQGAVIAVEIILGGSVGTDAAVAVEVDGDDAAAVRETDLAQRSSPEIGARTRDEIVEGGERPARLLGHRRGGLARSADQVAQRHLPYHQDAGERGDEQDRADRRTDRAMESPPSGIGVPAPDRKSTRLNSS